jgi:acetolactate synthase small subunit
MNGWWGNTPSPAEKKYDMKQDFTLEIHSDNNFSVINRIVNILNRRRVRIKKLIAHENEDDFKRGIAVILLHSTDDMMVKVKLQLEKLIEVEQVLYYTGSQLYCELSARHSELTV